MNRQQRRRRRPTNHAEWASGVAAVHEAAGGALDIFYVTPADLSALLIAAAIGDQEAAALVRATVNTIGHVNAAPTSTPALCGSCDNEIKGSAFVVVIASPLGKPLAGSTVVCSTLCPSCQSDVGGNALQSIRRIWPEARQVTVTHPEGARA